MLPDATQTREQFRWLAAEIVEMDGEATLWEASLVQGVSDEALIYQFQEQVNPGFQQILDRLQSGTESLEALSRRYQQLTVKDYFHSELGQRARQAILAARGKML